MEEVWKPIEGWPYEVSSYGNVRRTIKVKGTRAGEILKGGMAGKPGKQYPIVALRADGKTKYAYRHHLVAAAFIGPTPTGMEIDHKDGNKCNPRWGNLEFKTPSKNILGAVERGHRGENRWNSVLTEEIVRELRTFYGQGWTVRQLSGKFNLNESTIYHVVKRHNWRHVL